MFRPAVFLVLLGLMVPWVGHAQTPAAAATGWGLLGTWRYNCNAAPSRDDNVLTYVVRGGRLFHDRNWGDGTDSSVVTSAKIRPDGTLDLVIVFTSVSQTRENVVAKTPDGRVRVLVSRNIDTDQYLIKDGKFVASGSPMAPLQRCR
jgi:hypothetical protein